MNLETNKVIVKKTQEEMFEFLTKVENYEQIMPDNTDKFEVKGDSFLFALKGMPEIRLKLQEKTENDKVILGSTSDKFPFTLTGNIAKIDDKTSEVQLLFDGKFNPMMAMMIKNPIQKFIASLSENIAKL